MVHVAIEYQDLNHQVFILEVPTSMVMKNFEFKKLTLEVLMPFSFINLWKEFETEVTNTL